jgi:DNA-binding MarR family transcriptional regulator
VKHTLGTQLRHLIELLDGAVSAAYEGAGLRYRPRYTPVVRALMDLEPLTIGQIAKRAGITQPSATQTVLLMMKEGFLSAESSAEDGRQKLIRLSKQGRDLLPKLKVCWQATASAASSLEADLPFPLSQLLDSTIRALAAKSFEARIREARSKLTENTNESPLPVSLLERSAMRSRPAKSSPKASTPQMSIKR